MPRAGRDLSLTFAAAPVAACAAAAFAAMQALEDAALSFIVGGLLFVSLVSVCRSPQTDVARHAGPREGRLRR